MTIPASTIKIITEVCKSALPMRRFHPYDKFEVTGAFLNELNALLHRLQFSTRFDAIERADWKDCLSAGITAAAINKIEEE